MFLIRTKSMKQNNLLLNQIVLTDHVYEDLVTMYILVIILMIWKSCDPQSLPQR